MGMESVGSRHAGATRPRLAVLLTTVLALVVRLVWLGSKSLWVDEADSFYFASHTFPDILLRLCDPHPPAYYALLRLFLGLGRSEFWIRLPSAIAGALAIPLLYLLGRELSLALDAPRLSRRTAVLASLLLAVAPLHVWYSQEARMYAMVTTLGLCAVYFALRFALHREAVWAVGYVLAASAALYTDQTSALPLLLANLVWGMLWIHRCQPRTGRGWWQLVAWSGLQVVVGLAFWLWWSHALFPSLFRSDTLYQLAMLMLVLRRFGVSVSVDAIMLAFAAGAALLAVGGMVACWLVARRHRLGKPMPGLAWAVVVVFLLGTVGSAVPRLFTLKRLLVSLLPYGLLVGAWAMHELQFKPWLLRGLLLLSVALCVVNTAWWPKEPWREVVALVEREAGPGDVLWVDDLAVPAFDYYYGGPLQRQVLRTAHLREFHETLAHQRGSPREGRIWVLLKVDAYRNLLDYFSPSLSESLLWSGDWHHVSVRAYAPPAPNAGPLAPAVDPPPWLSAWPSPVHEACQTRE